MMTLINQLSLSMCGDGPVYTMYMLRRIIPGFHLIIITIIRLIGIRGRPPPGMCGILIIMVIIAFM